MLYPLYLFVASLAFSCTDPANVPARPGTLPVVDTVSIAASKRGFTLPKGQQHCQIELHIVKNPQWRNDARYQLVFDSVVAQTLPEGTYEIYLSTESPKRKAVFDPGDATFVDVLNLYNGGRSVSMNATRVVRQWLGRSKLPHETVYLTLFFRGNDMPDKKPLPHTGQLSAEKIRLVVQW